MNKLVEEFQCPGCVNGGDPCPQYKYEGGCYKRCMNHVLGTMIFPGGTIALGLPTGFCRPGFNDDGSPKDKLDVRLHAKDDTDNPPEWDRFNIAVWAMVKDGYLFVRTYAPRVNRTWVDVVEGGTLDMVPGAVNVAEFIDEMD